MKHFKRDNQYRNSTGTNVIQLDEEGELLNARSYGWYEYIKVFVHPKTLNKVVVLNRTSYSATTVRHIREAWKLLRVGALSDSFDLILDNVPCSLGDLENVINELIYQAKELEKEAKKPRTHASKNLERKMQACRLINQAAYLNELRGV